MKDKKRNMDEIKQNEHHFRYFKFTAVKFIKKDSIYILSEVFVTWDICNLGIKLAGTPLRLFLLKCRFLSWFPQQGFFHKQTKRLFSTPSYCNSLTN